MTKKSQLVPNDQDSGGIPLKTRQRLELHLNPRRVEVLGEAEHHTVSMRKLPDRLHLFMFTVGPRLFQAQPLTLQQ